MDNPSTCREDLAKKLVGLCLDEEMANLVTAVGGEMKASFVPSATKTLKQADGLYAR